MSIDIFHDTVVGVSFVSLVKDDKIDEDKFEKVAEKVGLTFTSNMYAINKTHDAFIGVAFRERPTDAEVAEAKVKVEGLLSKIEELMGVEADSAVEVWSAITIIG